MIPAVSWDTSSPAHVLVPRESEERRKVISAVRLVEG